MLVQLADHAQVPVIAGARVGGTTRALSRRQRGCTDHPPQDVRVLPRGQMQRRPQGAGAGLGFATGFFVAGRTGAFATGRDFTVFAG